MDLIKEIGSRYNEYGIKYVRSSAYEMPFPDEKFNIVASFATLEHISDPESALNEMIRVTKKNGIIYCQAAPLWNDAYGHHKKKVFPNDPWIHLRKNTPGKMKEFYGSYCDELVDDIKVFHHINYVFTDNFNRMGIVEYKNILGRLIPKISPVNIRFGWKYANLKLLLPEIRAELSNYSEEELITGSFTWIFRKI